MKDRSACMLDGHNCSNTEYEDDLMECSDFLDLVGLTKEMENGEVDIYIMAERIATLLGQTDTFETSDEDDLSCDDDDDDDDEELARDNSRLEWTSNSNNTNNHGHNLLLAGYTNCMDEAIRYLVEEEQYSSEHPMVLGLKHHLVSQQERVLVEAAARGNLTDADNRLAQRVEAFCTIRPPSI